METIGPGSALVVGGYPPGNVDRIQLAGRTGIITDLEADGSRHEEPTNEILQTLFVYLWLLIWWMLALLSKPMEIIYEVAEWMF